MFIDMKEFVEKTEQLLEILKPFAKMKLQDSVAFRLRPPSPSSIPFYGYEKLQTFVLTYRTFNYYVTSADDLLALVNIHRNISELYVKWKDDLYIYETPETKND